jgi:hypothetical protein
MKNIVLSALLLSCTPAFSQKIAGLFQGTLFNDTTRMVQQYELALSEYRGKITGYSYTTFVMDDVYYYGIRRIKASIKDDKLIVEDGDILVNNFPAAPDKGVRRISVIPLNGQDSVISLNGRWQTTRTKEFYSVPGSIDLSKTDDTSHSSLMRHLKELDLLPGQQSATAASSRQKPAKNEKEIPVRPGPVRISPPAPVVLAHNQRREEQIRVMEVFSDSLELSFYDNGVVDGDSVSIYLNGQNILQHIRLTATAAKTKIAVPKGKDVKIALVAESLGTIPPNTGLLVVRDGERSYQLTFSADMQTNASIIFRRVSR